MTMSSQTRLLRNESVQRPAQTVASIEEETQQCDPDDVEGRDEDTMGFMTILTILMIGVFISNADTSLVLATYGMISSEFNSLNKASWLVNGYMLSMSGTQPIFGKLSNLYGRKSLLLISYAFFAVGNLICGIGGTINVVILGRVIGGIGGAGMTSIVAFLVADLVPKRDIATYRSYINIVKTVGRSCGGPIGGALAQNFGWRWSFLIQVPLTVIAMLPVWLYLKDAKLNFQDFSLRAGSIKAKIRRIDFLGALLMCATIVFFLLPLTLGGTQYDWSHPIIPAFFIISGVLGSLFVYIELKVAAEPIFPMSLLCRRDIVIPYAVLLVQTMSQTLLMFLVPLYFQITENVSPQSAGLHLVPAIFGNTIGGLFAGAYVRKTGLYKFPTNLAAAFACLGYLLIVLRWDGRTNLFESLYNFFSGLGGGIANSTIFVAITVASTEEELAIAGSGLYLSSGIGAVMGTAVASSALRIVLRATVTARMGDDENIRQVIEHVLRDASYLQRLTGHTKKLILAAYVIAFRACFGLGLLLAFITLTFGLFMREKRL